MKKNGMVTCVLLNLKHVTFQEEEGERSQKWKEFLEQQAEFTRPCQSKEDNTEPLVSEVTEQPSDPDQAANEGRDDSAEQCGAISEVTAVEKVSSEEGNSSEKGSVRSVSFKEAPSSQHGKPREVKTWADISPSLYCLDNMMSVRIKKSGNMNSTSMRCETNDLPSIDEARSSDGGSEDDNERIDSANAPAVETSSGDKLLPEICFPTKQELESLVQGGVPKDLRGEVQFYPCTNCLIFTCPALKFLYIFAPNWAGVASICWRKNSTSGKILPRFASCGM